MDLNVTSSRDRSLDMLKGFGILLMVFDHVRFGELSHIWISSFHMPLFFIVSGYLFHDRTYKDFFKRKWRTLWIPYLIFGFLFLIISVLVFRNGETFVTQMVGFLFLPTSLTRMHFSAPLWFIPCIFLVELVFLFLYKTIHSKRIFGCIIVAISMSGAVLAVFLTSTLPLAIGPALFSLLFYYLGFLIHSSTRIQKYISTRSSKVWACVILFVIGTVCAYTNGVTDIRSTKYGFFVLFLASGLSLTLFFWIVFRVIDKNQKTESFCKALSYFGSNSLAFLCCNYAIIKFLKWTVSLLHFNENKWTVFFENVAIFFITIFCIIFIEKIINVMHLSWVIGKPKNNTMKG